MTLAEQLTGNPVLVSGRNGAIATGEETVWDQGGTLSPLAAATAIKVSSSSANDTSAGTGARTVQVIGLDSDYNVQLETLTLSGQTAVQGTQVFSRILGVDVLTAGSGGVNAGTVYVFDDAGAVTSGVPNTASHIQASIVAGANASQVAAFTSPNRVPYLIQAVYLSSMAQYCRFRIYIRPYGGLQRLAWEYGIGSGGNQGVATHIILPPKADLVVAGLGGGASAIATAQLQMIPWRGVAS